MAFPLVSNARLSAAVPYSISMRDPSRLPEESRWLKIARARNVDFGYLTRRCAKLEIAIDIPRACLRNVPYPEGKGAMYASSVRSMWAV